jgi:dephospho-CoA kinase
MLAIGITGGIGSGKTLVCNVFRSLNVPVYEADQEARRIMAEDPVIRNRIIEHFGEEVYSGGSLNRPYLARRIFENTDEREFVNSLIHPAVREDFLNWMRQHGSIPYAIEEAALIFESGAYRELDMTILVTAPVKLRMDRIKQRDKLANKEISARMSSQIRVEEAEKLADYVIINDDKTFVLPQVLEIHQKIMDIA